MGEGFGGGDADFGTGMEIDATVGLSGNGDSHDVADRKRDMPPSFGFAQGSDQVR